MIMAQSRWVVVSAIVSLRLRKGKQRHIPLYENFYLMEVLPDEDIWDKAKQFALSQLVEDETLMLNNQPARFHFEGIRKIVSVSNPSSEEYVDSRPISGTELTYSEYSVRTEKQLKKLVNGEAVKILYIE